MIRKHRKRNDRRGGLLLYITLLFTCAALMLYTFAGCTSQNGGDTTGTSKASAGEISAGSPHGNISQDDEGSSSGNSSGAVEISAQHVSKFLFFSDTQADPETGDYSGFGELLATALSRCPDPDIVIFGGDSVNDGADANEWDAFHKVVDPLLTGLTTASAVGNHDNCSLLKSQFTYPADSSSGAGNGFFYSLSAGPVFFIILDSNAMGAANQKDIEWLRSELQSSAAGQAVWRIAVMHHPMWIIADNPKDEQRAETMRESFLPLLEEYGVDLILCGHQHSYARTLPMSRGSAAAGGYAQAQTPDTQAPDAQTQAPDAQTQAPYAQSQEERGVVQIMAASGDKGSYTAGKRDYIAAAGSAPVFLVIEASQDTLRITALDGNGSKLDFAEFSPAGLLSAGRSPAAGEPAADSSRIRVLSKSGVEIWSFSEETLSELAVVQDIVFTHIYSTINNWPSVRFYAAEGYKIENILKNAGVFDKAQTITFRSADSYEISLTREQLLSSQYYFPNVGDNRAGAKKVFPIIAFRWREGTDNIGDVREDKPLLIFGQREFTEHTNPAFIIGLAEIIVDEEPCERWSAPSAFPLPGPIAAGETVKLQHADYGLVKLYYTTDGSDPTMQSSMYNPSTYQPELNRPIMMNEPVVIKAIAVGYGREDSEIAVLEYQAVG